MRFLVLPVETDRSGPEAVVAQCLHRVVDLGYNLAAVDYLTPKEAEHQAMKMNFTYAAALQLKLLGMYGYSCTPHDFSSWPGSLSDPWQTGVDTLYRLFASGLLRSGDFPSEVLAPWDEDLQHARLLSTLDPEDPDLVGLVHWSQKRLWLTPKAKELINKYDVWDYPNEKVCEPFIEEIEALFSLHGVPWSELALVPIQRSASSNDDLG